MASQFIIPNPTANQTALGHYSGPSYDAGVAAGREAGIVGQAPPVANISIDVLCARFGEIPLARYDLSSGFKHKYLLFSSKKNIEPEVCKKGGWEQPRSSLDDIAIAALRDSNPSAAPEQTLTPQQRVNLTTPEYKAGVVVGYVEGITFYVAQQGLLKLGMKTPTVLFSESAWQAYARGLAMESPGIAREVQHPKSEFKFLHNKYADEDHRELSARINAQRTAGYHLGFAVRIAREYGVALDATNTPSDNESYKAFMRGLRGEQDVILPYSFSRRSEEPMHRLKSEDKGSKYFYQEEILDLKEPAPLNYYQLQQEIFARLEQNMYKAGQQVRLAAGK